MDELHRHRSFAHSGSHALHRTMAHIAHGKNAGNIGLQQERIALERPALGALPVPYEVGTGQDETAFVALDQIRPASPFAAALR